MNIHGKKVVLRALESSDMESLRSFHNDPAIGQLLGGWSHPISSEQQIEWFQRQALDTHNLRFAIDTKEDGFIGVSTITNIDIKNRSAYHGIIIGKKNMQGHGYGRDTVMTTMKYAFEELQLHRLDGDIVEHNVPSYNLFVHKCGWKEEGRIREHAYRNNRYYDRIIVGILKNEYEELCNQQDYWGRKTAEPLKS
ncbi:GNAT family N-acetyltransferase [Planococcus dechangensis]|uniref:GNAT family N-acetyltransferase n=1 Tax=Planococcus dechangensis TaxID=1176255 RepID=A0ABV9MBY2_9BACL